MIREVRVENYKSVANLELHLGRFNVLIGANGCGKSNILEAIALAAAASQQKLDNEFLIARGIRATEPTLMLSAFAQSPSGRMNFANRNGTAFTRVGVGKPRENRIKIGVWDDGNLDFVRELWADEETSYPRWEMSPALPLVELLGVLMQNSLPPGTKEMREYLQGILNPDSLDQAYRQVFGSFPDFLIYAPENSALRTFQAEGQILPLGIRGEGLFAHLKGLNTERHRDRLARIQEKLKLLDWFEGFDIPEDLGPGERALRIRDGFLKEGVQFDQRSANEGFLFLLFYLTLFISPETPAFFAIDKIDSSLNPKLCQVLLQDLVGLAREYDKQVIVTTHNPAVLDGLDLNDDEQRLFVVERDGDGHTRTRRISAPKPRAGHTPVRLSDAFLRGYIGGLPNNF